MYQYFEELLEFKKDTSKMIIWWTSSVALSSFDNLAEHMNFTFSYLLTATTFPESYFPRNTMTIANYTTVRLKFMAH